MFRETEILKSMIRDLLLETLPPPSALHPCRTLLQLFASVLEKVVDIYLVTSWLGKYPPLFTSSLVNNEYT